MYVKETEKRSVGGKTWVAASLLRGKIIKMSGNGTRDNKSDKTRPPTRPKRDDQFVFLVDRKLHSCKLRAAVTRTREKENGGSVFSFVDERGSSDTISSVIKKNYDSSSLLQFSTCRYVSRYCEIRHIFAVRIRIRSNHYTRR